MHNSCAKRLFHLVLVGLLLTIFSGALWGQNLEIHYINVQQGQSVLIIGPNGTTILLDGGFETKGTTEVAPYLQSLGILTTQPLDYIIASHRDTDHFVGLTEVINSGYDALHIYDNGSDKTNTYVQAFLDAAAHTTAGGVTAIPLGMVIDLGDGAKATCIVVNGSVIGIGAIPGALANENDRSICLLIQYNNFDFVIGGDMGGGAGDYDCTGRNTDQINMETPMLQAIMPAGVNPLLSQYGVEVAHVGHHGSESSTNADYMNVLTPMIGCISVGAGQGSTYFHPRIDVVEHVLLVGSPCITAPAALVLQTEEGNPTGATTSFAGYCVGDIVIRTDGVNSYTISASGAVSQGPDERIAAGLPVTYYFEEYTAIDRPPIIYGVHDVGTNHTSTQITWCTNETANSVVRFGTSPGTYTNTVSDASLVLNHQAALSGLMDYATYYYVVESTDTTGNITTSPEHSFQTFNSSDIHVVFSEVYYDTIGTDSVEEWIELYNNSPVTANIGGWQIIDNNGTGASFTIPAGVTMAPNSYFTIAVNSTGFINLYGYNADLYGAIPSLNNTGEALVLRDSGGIEKDAVAMEGGASAGVPAGWGSSTEPNAPTGSTIVRIDVTTDTNTYVDWTTAPNNGNPQTQPVIENTIIVISPNGGESWLVGAFRDITWTSKGMVGNVDIHYSTDNGVSWIPVATNVVNNGLYTWTVPDTLSATCLVRVQETDGSPTDISNAVFSIIKDTSNIRVVFSEAYYDTIGTDSVEEWIELYNNSPITVDIGGWKITDNNGTGATFTIPAGKTMAPNSYFTIAANSAGFNALYSRDADLYGSIPALNNDGDALILRDSGGIEKDAVGWEGGASAGIPSGWGSSTAPNAPTGSTIVRINVNTDSNTYADWTIAVGNGNPQTQPVEEKTITVLTPNGGESWIVGTTHDITWTSSGTVGNLNISYSTDSGLTWVPIVNNTDNDGLSAWTIPTVMPSTTCLVRVQEIDGSPSDSSDAFFSIEPYVAETISAPTAPSGPSSGIISTVIDFSTIGSASNLGHNVQYLFDWGDGSNSDWLAVGILTASHNWAAPGTYSVRAMARCATDTEIVSEWSEIHVIVVTVPGLAGPDFNGDGKTDIVWRNILTGQNMVWYMDGVAKIGEASLPTLATRSWDAVGLGDFNADNKPDILWRNLFTGQNIVWYMDGAAKIGEDSLPKLANPIWKPAGVGDFNWDGRSDILWRNLLTGQNMVWFMDGVTKIGEVSLPTLATRSWDPFGLGDFNADNKPDILWRNLLPGQNMVWYMDGVTKIGDDFLPPLNYLIWKAVGVGDFNSDGKPDILCRNLLTGQNMVWYMDGVAKIGEVSLPIQSDLSWKIVN